MEKFESQQYRKNLAEEIRGEPDKENKKEIVAEIKKTDEYQAAKRIHQELASLRNDERGAEEIHTGEGKKIDIPITAETKENNKLISLEELERIVLSKNTPKKKVLLIEGNTPHLIEESEDRKGYFFSSKDESVSDSTNLGIHRIAGYLDKFGVPNEIVRLQDIDSQEDIDRVIKDADIIAMSALSPSINEAFSFCSEVKNRYPEKTIVGGAEHFALDYEWILSHPEETGVDMCCVSQGELPILALASGIPSKKIGSIAYIENTKEDDSVVIRNNNFPRIGGGDSDLLESVPARLMKKEWMPMIFPELRDYFDYAGSTQTGTGCPLGCNFCTNKRFLDGKYTKTLGTAEQEIKALYEQGVDFTFVREPMFNTRPKHVADFLEFMKEQNEAHDKKMRWFAFAAVKKLGKMSNEEFFKKMAEAGCLEAAVGVEDPLDNREDLGKHGSLGEAVDFINAGKEELLVRALLILGLPSHYEHSRKEIKNTFLDFMKQNPQALYRINSWTPIVGTEDFDDYSSVLHRNVREDVGAFREHDTMHGVIDPQKMYDKLEISEDKQWIKTTQDLVDLRNEIIREYLESEEHQVFLEGLKGKKHLGQKGLLHDIATNFRDITLEKTS